MPTPARLLSPPGRVAEACYLRPETGFRRFVPVAACPPPDGRHVCSPCQGVRPRTTWRPPQHAAPATLGTSTTSEGADRHRVGVMNRFAEVASSDLALMWVHIWFGQLARFHRKTSVPDWEFSADEVIVLLRRKRDAGVPAWKRMKVIEGLIDYRRSVRKAGYDGLKPLREKMGDIIVVERARTADGRTIGEAATRIDPNEPDVLQAF